MNNNNKKSAHVSGSGGGGILTNNDLENSSDGTPFNQSLTSYQGIWIQVPVRIADAIAALFAGDYTKVAGKAEEFLDIGFLVAQSFGSIVSADQLRQAMNDGAERLGHQGKNWIKEMQEISESHKKEIEELHTNGNSKLVDSLNGTVALLDKAIKEISNPKNTESVPFSVAKLAEEKVAVALSKAQKAQEYANTEQKEALEIKLNSLEVMHAKLLQSIESERESLRELLGLQGLVTETKKKSSGKGTLFEDEVSEELMSLTGIFGDELQDIGDLTDGIGSSKVGDHLITVKSANQAVSKIVVEDKAGSFNIGGAKGIIAQLNKAMQNYGATVAIGVVDSENAPVKLRKNGYQRYQSNIHLVCVDWEARDFSSLEILYPLVREMALLEHESFSNGSDVDKESIISLCNECLTRLKDINKLKRNLRDVAAKTTLNVATELELMQSELKDNFTRLIRIHRGDSN
tara:strand:+ start:2853 stop:4235 length:1383 start_codon:yes stop_codon:yes gene_type:complete